MMRRVIVIDDRDGVAEALAASLSGSPPVEMCARASRREDLARRLRELRIDTAVYSPPLLARRQFVPDLADASAVFGACAEEGVARVVVLSSAAVYGACPQNPGLMYETRSTPRGVSNPVGDRWAELEKAALESLGARAGIRVTILRPAPVIVRGGADYFSRLFAGTFPATLPGYDPSIQLLSVSDLACAVRRAVECEASGTYNVAPDGVIPLCAALRLAGALRLPVARTLQRAARAALAPLGLAHPAAQLEYIRYPWTVSNEKIKRELGVTFNDSSADALIDFASGRRGARRRARAISGRRFDDFGLDKDFIAFRSRTTFKFLRRLYWRIEVDGFEKVPREGRAILVGIHRGGVPWDGGMVIDLLSREHGRYPRFLMHPGLVKFPFAFNLVTKIGGVIACRENAARMMERGEVLGIFPEGLRGPFRLYRDAYKLGKFQNDFVKIALRYRAPIVPFVIVGSAEIFPMLGKLEWEWWKRYSQWPFFPLSPTFPFLPLPSKWHMQFLAPVKLDEYPPESADDAALVREISDEVKRRMKAAMDEILGRRKSVFYGSVFRDRARAQAFEREAN